jgi:hypothetical protein
MPAPFHGRKGLVALLAIICLLPGSPPTAASSGPVIEAPWQGCGVSAQALDRLRADLSLDNTLANRADSLATAGLGSGQPTPANELQSFTEDNLDGLGDASEQLEQVTNEISQQLEEMKLPRQQRAWSQGVEKLRTARTNLRYVTRPGSLSGGRIGSLAVTGVGVRMMTEAATAATDYGTAAAQVNDIARDANFMDMGRPAGIQQQGRPDMDPPPNPLPDPWQEWLRRMQAQQARVRNSVSGLNAARALQGNQFQQAQQHAANMKTAIQEAQRLANQLGQMAALCNQPNVNQSRPVNQPATAVGPKTPASSAGGGMSAVAKGSLFAAGLGGAAVLAVAASQAAEVCTEPDQSKLPSCLSGNCSSCVALSQEFAKACDCLERKGDVAGICGDFRRDIEAFRREFCLVPESLTRVPKPAIKR